MQKSLNPIWVPKIKSRIRYWNFDLFLTFEPVKNNLTKTKNDSNKVVFDELLRGQDSNLQPIDYTYLTVSNKGGLYLYHIK